MTKIVESIPLKTWVNANKVNSRVSSSKLLAYIAANEKEGIIAAPAPAPVPTPTPLPTPVPVPVPVPTPSGDNPSGIAGNFTLTFKDDFDTLNTSVWNTNWLGAPGKVTKPINSAEIAAYDPANVTVEGSMLILSAKAGPVVASDGKTYQYSSGMVESAKSSSKAGLELTPGVIVEAKIKSDGNGPILYNWPAFWMNGHHNSWPDRGENDIYENLSDGPAYHYHAPSVNVGKDIKKADYSGWHTYACEWLTDRIDYYYDGQLVGSVTSGVLSFPNYLVLNLGLSPQHGGPVTAPAKMFVDYVKVWKRV